jgi:hypothetical protein
VRNLSHAGSLSDIGWDVEKSISFMMLGDLNEVLCTRIGKEINPFFRIVILCCEVLDKVIVHMVGPVGVKVVLVEACVVRAVGTLVHVPPIPLGILFC